MISILVNDIIPILVIMILGYLCGKFSFFNDDQRQGLIIVGRKSPYFSEGLDSPSLRQ